MTHYDWLTHWEQDDIPFHFPAVNPLLEKYWPQLNIAKPSHVLVPLCGKTKDLLWLANQGCQVSGVELSPIACESFFVENGLSFSKADHGSYSSYESEKIKLFCGDIFKLPPNLFSTVTAIYDRAALIALSSELRQNYANYLVQLTHYSAKQILLIVIESSDQVQGPPYPISLNDLTQLYKDQFSIQELVRISKTDIPEHLQNKGYRILDEVVYRLTKV